MRVPKKRCLYCHQWFVPNRRKIAIQKACAKRACQKRRHSANCQVWRRINPGQDKSRRSKIRVWARDYPDYWRANRAKHPGYVRRDNERRSQARKGVVSAAKRDSIKRISDDKLREIQSLGPATAAKRDSIDRRVDGILDYLIWKESAAKRDSALGASP